jgi:hypothetical protein
MSGSAYNEDRRDAGPTELAAFQSALARLQPAPEGINLARLLFRAGQLSASRRSWAWPCITAASLIWAAALGALLLFRPAPQPTERIVTIYIPFPTPLLQPEPSVPSIDETPVPPPPVFSVSEEKEGSGGDYLQLRRQVLAHGLDALPPPPPWPAAAPIDDTDTLLDLPRGNYEPWRLRFKYSLQLGGPL